LLFLLVKELKDEFPLHPHSQGSLDSIKMNENLLEKPILGKLLNNGEIDEVFS